MKNYWGEPDDDNFLPEWMNPKTYRNKPTIGGVDPKRKTLEEAAAEALKKPAIPILLKDPTKKE